MQSNNLDPTWHKYLKDEFQRPYMLQLKNFLVDQLKQKKIIYPHGKDFFAALNQTPLDKVKVVIIGQDPYHGPDQAHGLSFSVRPDVQIPPSLKNIFKELQQDLGVPIPKHGHLTAWAKQGVLLLNNVLSVEAHNAGSHRKKGWEQFTDKVVEILNDQTEHLVFMLWGRDARQKGSKLDRKKHLILESGHPSPLSVRYFLGNRHFSQANHYLKTHGKTPIDWSL